MTSQQLSRMIFQDTATSGQCPISSLMLSLCGLKLRQIVVTSKLLSEKFTLHHLRPAFMVLSLNTPTQEYYPSFTIKWEGEAQRNTKWLSKITVSLWQSSVWAPTPMLKPTDSSPFALQNSSSDQQQLVSRLYHLPCSCQEMYMACSDVSFIQSLFLREKHSIFKIQIQILLSSILLQKSYFFFSFDFICQDLRHLRVQKCCKQLKR